MQINAELIETIESTPDTLITLTTGKRMMVAEDVSEIVDRVMAYRVRIHQPTVYSGGRRREG